MSTSERKSRKGPKKQRVRKKTNEPVRLPTLRPNAAGVDLGSMENWGCVPSDRDPEPIRKFGSFTRDLNAMADWFEKCGIDTVVMESTGVYWIPLFQILSDRGMEVFLVNARYYRNVAGRPTDAGDCQWLQYLHSVGLVKGSFRPAQAICALRTLVRHRDNLVKAATTISQQIQKSLDQMNVKLQYVLSDILGVSGLTILDALIGGERDVKKLAELRDPRVEATQEEVEKALEGDFRLEHMFVLEQSLRMYRRQHEEIERLDKSMEQYMAELAVREVPVAPVEEQPALEAGKKKRGRPKGSGKKSRKQGGHGNEPAYDLESYCTRIAGVNLAVIPGFGPQTAQVILTEIGPDVSAFSTVKQFCSWLRLCPYQEITGGKLLSSRSRKSKNRARNALRVAAQSLHSSQKPLGGYLRKMKARLGKAEGITAAAHKLARVVYHMLTTKEPYDETLFAKLDEQYQTRQVRRLENLAKAHGFQLVARGNGAAEGILVQ